ncbi:MAG TPA: hypothetical protein VHP80_10575, partial [Candidatus Acidoferrum sp.]|nr:hypothetical protein [Candidatus Acidoferrum sp.]
LDGSLIFAADSPPELNRAVASARGRLLDGRWSNLSRVFNAAASPVVTYATTRVASPSESRRHLAQSNATDLDLDEGAQA